MHPRSKSANRLFVSVSGLALIFLAQLPVPCAQDRTPRTPDTWGFGEPPKERIIVRIAKVGDGISSKFSKDFQSALKPMLPKPGEKSLIWQSNARRGLDKKISNINEMLAAEEHTFAQQGYAFPKNSYPGRENDCYYVPSCYWCGGDCEYRLATFGIDQREGIAEVLRERLHIKATDPDAVFAQASQMFLPNFKNLFAQVISTLLIARAFWLFVRFRKPRSLILLRKAPGNT